MDPTFETVAVGPDLSLFTRTFGEGPDTIVLHGGPGAHHDYLLPYFDDLASGRRLRYYDQRGGGRSPVPYDTDVGWKAHVADLDALIDHWNLADPVTLVGYSWGGLLAMLYAIEHPQRVGRLALVSPAPATAEGRREFEDRFAARAAAPPVASLRADLKQSGLKEANPAAYRQRAFELSVAAYFADPARARDLTPFRVTGRTQREGWSSLGAYDLRPGLEHLGVSAVVLHGRHDPIPIATAQDTARRLRAPFREMPNSGHVPYLEDRELFRATLDEFLPAS